MTKDELSLQFSFRHEDMRLRVMIQYEMSAFLYAPSTSIKIPSALTIADISISREGLVEDASDIETMKLGPPRSIRDRYPVRTIATATPVRLDPLLPSPIPPARSC